MAVVAALSMCRPLRALDPTQKPSSYIATHWDTETGLPHNAVKKIFQTRDGYIWIGTLQGIARFDGITFTIFNQHNTPGILNSQVTSFAETADGSLWISTSFGLTRYLNGQFKTYTQADGVKSTTGTLNALCVVPDGSLWIGGQNGITRWVDGKFIQDIDTSAYNTLGLRDIKVDRTGTVWITTGAEVLRYRDGKFSQYTNAQGLSGKNVQTVTEDGGGRVVAVTQDGLFVFDRDRFVPFEQNAALSSRRAGAALTDRAGNFWIGSSGGLDRYVNGTVMPYIDRFGNSPGVVDTLFEDRENCLWFGTSNGFYRLTDRRGYSLAEPEGITAPQGTVVVQTHDQAIWLASWAGGVERFLNGNRTHYGPGAPLSHESITHIYEAPDHTMWFGTRGSAVDHLLPDGKVATYVYQSGVATSRPATAIYITEDGETLIGISKRGLLHLKDGAIVPVPEATFLAPETIWTINRLRDGRLLIGTSKGMYQRAPDQSWTPLDIPGVPSPVVARSLIETANGTIWIATEGRGLVRWRNGTGHAYDTRRGMIDDTVFSVVDDQLGAIWVSSARGIARIRQTDFDDVDGGMVGTLNCMSFGREDGLLSGSTSGVGAPAAARLSDGRIMTATDHGFAVIEPRSIQTNARPPTVVIESAIANDRPLPLHVKVVVPADTNRLELHYTALSLISPQRLRFRYQLKGSDPNWVEAGRQRTATYTHLAPGHYTFHVLACNNDGIWNDSGASLAFEMQPHFYQTIAFRVLVGTAIVVLLASLIGWRMRQLKLKQLALAKANAELDQRVKERTAELSRSHAELEQRESLFRLIFEHAPVGVSWHRTDLGPEHHFNSAFRTILGLPAGTMSDDSYIASLVHPDDFPRKTELDAKIRSGEMNSYTTEQRFIRRDGTQIHALFATAVVRDEYGNIVQVIGILEDISAQKAAEQELAKTYKRLVDLSRASGMAEVATGVLHNVGNVLNSVNVSVSMMADGLRQSRVAGLTKLCTLLQEHATNLGAFLHDDPRGQRVLPYLTSMAEHLRGDHERMLSEVESLRANVEHIKEIVARQQSLAQQGGLVERLSAPELLEDALEMNTMAMMRHGIEIVRDIQPTPLFAAERHKVLQILMNLIQNAKEALKAGRAEGRRLTVRVRSRDGFIRFEIGDNGIGIVPENLTRIFEHGFTTRSDGHGFGLHSSAIAAKQMNGSVTAQSEGLGTGATFVLELPVAPGAAVVVDFTSVSDGPGAGSGERARPPIVPEH